MPLRKMLIAAIAAALVALGGGQAGAKSKLLDSHCTPTGDYCNSVYRSKGRVKLQLATFSFRGTYTLCATPPAGVAECHDFQLHSDKHGIFVGRVDFARNFAHSVKGRYAVGWSQGGGAIGPMLKFRNR